MTPPFDFQPILRSQLLTAFPLLENDFEELYGAASDPAIWEQHPNPLRYKRDVFQNFFQGALESGGAFIIRDNRDQKAIGSSRFYDYDSIQSRVLIGYTFLAKAYWGGKYNGELKELMINHAFRFVDHVHFHIGALNKRSQLAMEKIGGVKIDEIDVPYHGETSTLNFIYEIKKEDWLKKS